MTRRSTRFATCALAAAAIAMLGACAGNSPFASSSSSSSSSSAAASGGADAAQPLYSGYLCCNLRSDGSWMSDSNYAENGKRIVPLGTPMKVTGYGRQRVNVEFDGRSASIGNDYSRDLSPAEFARRWVKTEDPRARLATFPPRVQQAIRSARIMPGMTREQVIMSLGYPISSENPDVNAPLLRYWRTSFGEFQVLFDKQGRVREITTDPQTRNLVVME